MFGFPITESLCQPRATQPVLGYPLRMILNYRDKRTAAFAHGKLFGLGVRPAKGCGGGKSGDTERPAGNGTQSGTVKYLLIKSWQFHIVMK
jgi:hypothetical protein